MMGWSTLTRYWSDKSGCLPTGDMAVVFQCAGFCQAVSMYQVQYPLPMAQSIAQIHDNGIPGGNKSVRWTRTIKNPCRRSQRASIFWYSVSHKHCWKKFCTNLRSVKTLYVVANRISSINIMKQWTTYVHPKKALWLCFLISTGWVVKVWHDQPCAGVSHIHLAELRAFLFVGKPWKRSRALHFCTQEYIESVSAPIFGACPDFCHKQPWNQQNDWLPQKERGKPTL